MELLKNAIKQVGNYPRPNGEPSTSQGFRIYSIDGKSVSITANGGVQAERRDYML